MTRKMGRAAALLLLLGCLLGLTACGNSGEKSVVGEIISLSDREAIIRVLSTEEVPENEAFQGVEYILFSTEVLDHFTVNVGDVVTLLCRGDIPEGESVWMESLSWSLYEGNS